MMKCINKWLLLSTLCFSSFLTSEEESKVYIATVAKSGTYLLIKALKLMNVHFHAAQGPYEEETWPQIGKPHIAHHMRGKTINELSTVFNPQHKYIVTYRDPRDWIISYLNWVSIAKDRKIDYQWLEIPFIDRLKQAINGTTLDQYNTFLNWERRFWDVKLATELKKRNWDHVLMLRFEDLIGPNGGGSFKQQIESLKKINEFLSLELSNDEIEQISYELWGGTFTFTEKTNKIGQWRGYFDQEAISGFKSKHNDLLVDLGYEVDDQW